MAILRPFKLLRQIDDFFSKIWDKICIPVIPRLAVAVTATKSLRLRLRSNPKPQRIFNILKFMLKTYKPWKYHWKCNCGVHRSCLKIKLCKRFVLAKNFAHFCIFYNVIHFAQEFKRFQWVSVDVWASK